MQQEIKSRVVGVDISIKRTTYAIVDVRGNIHASDHFPTTDYTTANDFITALSEKIITMTEANGGYEQIRSIGVSSPSANFLTGCIENAANLPWKGIIPLGAMLRDRMGIAVAVGNDAHVSALGEYSYGCAHGMNNFIIVSLGHGIGSCIYPMARYTLAPMALLARLVTPVLSTMAVNAAADATDVWKHTVLRRASSRQLRKCLSSLTSLH